MTVEGVGLVIDSGLSRQLRCDPNTGMSLETVPSSVASADSAEAGQASGPPAACGCGPRRTAAAPCLQSSELQLADPMPLVMELAQWGAGWDALPWLDPPSPAALRGSRHWAMEW